MKKIILTISLFFILCVKVSAQYTIDGRSVSEENITTSYFISLGFAQPSFAIQKLVVDFDTIYTFLLKEVSSRGYEEYPEDGVLMLKLGNEENLKLYRFPVRTIKEQSYSTDYQKTYYTTKCAYLFEKGMIDKVVEHGIIKARIQYLNNQYYDVEVKPKKLPKQIESLKDAKARLEKKIEDGF